MEIKTLARRFCDYSLVIKGLSKGTIKRYRFVIEYYCRQSGVMEIEEVNEENVRGLFFFGRMERKWKANTFITFHKSLSVFFQWCVKEGFMRTNPATAIETPRLEKRIPPKLSKQESMRILEAAFNYPYRFQFDRYRNHAIIATFLFAGLRRQELLNLKFCDVDMENLSIFVRQGKGAKDRMVPISSRLAEILDKYLAERSRMHKNCPEFFASTTRNAGITNITLRRLVEKLREASEIKFTLHRLRHTFATLMLEGGVDIYSLSKMMGHADIKTTCLYLAASAEHLRAEMRKHPLNDI